MLVTESNYKFLSVLYKLLQFETLIFPRDVLQGKTEMEEIQPISLNFQNPFSRRNILSKAFNSQMVFEF